MPSTINEKLTDQKPKTDKTENSHINMHSSKTSRDGHIYTIPDDDIKDEESKNQIKGKKGRTQKVM